jgi:GTP-binding protein
MPADGSDPVENALTIVNELDQYSPKLASKPRWLVFNKVDLMLEEEANELCAEIAAKLGWEDDYYQISAFQKLNVDTLCQDVMEFIEQLPPEEQKPVQSEDQEFTWDTYHEKVIAEHQHDDDDLDDDDWDDDDYDVEVVYQK